MLTIRGSTWHAKVYTWFRNDCGKYDSGAANLCLYMRTVLFWAPLRWLLLSGRIGPVRIPLVFYPTLLVALPAIVASIFGWEAGLAVLAIYLVFLIAGILLAAYCGTVYLIKLLAEKLGRARTIDSFLDVSAEYVSAVHSKICPTIRFTNGNPPESK